MTLPDFLTEFAITGHVEGTGIHATPDQWQDALGGDFIDDRAKKRFRRDYGLVELGFWRAEDEWRCATISIQVHRLWRQNTTGPAKLHSEYGSFPTLIQFGELRERIKERGHELQGIEDTGPSDHRTFYVPASKVTISAFSPRDHRHDDLPSGAVWSLNLSHNADAWIRPH